MGKQTAHHLFGDSAGVYLPMQDKIFPDKEHFGRIFRNNAKMSSMGIIKFLPLWEVVFAGGTYLNYE